MRWYREVPKFITEAVDDTIINVSKHCKPCDVIVSRVIVNKKIISDEKFASDSKEHLTLLALYAYYKGVLDALNLETDKAKEDYRITAKHKVIEYKPKTFDKIT
jgi:hypothetical protein